MKWAYDLLSILAMSAERESTIILEQAVTRAIFMGLTVNITSTNSTHQNGNGSSDPPKKIALRSCQLSRCTAVVVLIPLDTETGPR